MQNNLKGVLGDLWALKQRYLIYGVMTQKRKPGQPIFIGENLSRLENYWSSLVWWFKESLVELLVQLRMSMIKSQEPWALPQTSLWGNLNKESPVTRFLKKVAWCPKLKPFKKRYCHSPTHKILLLTERDIAKKEKEKESENQYTSVSSAVAFS